MENISGEEDRKEQGEAFWINVRMQLESGAALASPANKNIVSALAGGKKARGWMSMIPIGLVSSYRYLYDCVKGLGCEDADIIERDVLRTVGAVKDGPGVFGDTSELGKAGKARAMHRVLTAISITDSMGYCQGMNYVVDFLLKMVNEEDAFCLFLYVLRNKHLCCLYETKLPVLSEYMEIYERQLSHRLPDLAHYLKEHGFIAPFYSIEWFTTMFVLSCPLELTIAIWDMLLMGFKDVLIRCAVALMESIEAPLMMMGTEELLKNFRTVAMYKVDPMDVVLRALRLHLVPVKVGGPDLYASPTANGVNQENHNYSNPTAGRSSGSSPTQTSACFLIDPRGKTIDDSSGDSVEPGATPQSSGSNLQGDILLTLRLRYLRKAREAMQERDMTSGKWAQEQLQRVQQKNNGERVSDEGNIIPISHSNSDRESFSSTSDVESEVVGGDNSDPSGDDSKKVEEEDTGGNTDADDELSVGNREHKKEFTMNNYFEFVIEGELMSKAYALKEVVSSCDRVTQWVHLNQKWADCLEAMENKLSQYNMADHMLRYAITINAHIRVISFFLAVAGADPNSQDRWLRTPLHFAAVHNRPDVVRVLLLAGADSSIPGALNKSLAIAPISSPLNGALKSGRMVTPTVLCQATYGNSLASYPASLTILKGKSCIICNVLESSSLGSAAKRRHSRSLNGRIIANMQVQAIVRTAEAQTSSESSTPSSPLTSGRIAISNCPRCNIPMCAWCLPDHHCIYDIIQEEFTWKVNLVKAQRSTSKCSDASSVASNTGMVRGAVESNARSSKKGSRALRELGRTLLMRRPSLFGKTVSQERTDIELRATSDSDDEKDLDRSSCSTASGELVESEENRNQWKGEGHSDEGSDSIVERHSVVDVADVLRDGNDERVSKEEDCSSDSDDSGFECPSRTKAINAHHNDDSRGRSGSAILKSPKVLFSNVFKSSPASHERESRKSISFSGGLKKMKARMAARRKSSPLTTDINQELDDNYHLGKGGMPMYWIGYRDEANRQATLQPWQIILLPLVQGGEYNRVLCRSGNGDIEATMSNHHKRNVKKPTLEVGSDSDDDSDAGSVNAVEMKIRKSTASEKSAKFELYGSDTDEDDRDDEFGVRDEDIHQQVHEIYFNSLRYPEKNSNAYVKRKEPKYLYFVSEMEGVYRTLGRDATEIFSIEPLPPPPPMITSVTASYLHVKHHRQSRCHPHTSSKRRSRNGDSCDNYESWDGELQTDDRVWVDAPAKTTKQDNSEVTSEVPAFRRRTTFSSLDKKPSRQEMDQDAAEAKFQRQLQIKGMNGLKKEALKRFLSGTWKLSEDDEMWVPDEDAWYCRKCSEQFSLFRRKHHCRRCGNVFCDEDAPRVDASECLHESLQQAYQGVLKEEYGGKTKKEKLQFRLCLSCKNEIRHAVGLYIELDFLLPRYNFSTWLISLLSKTYNNMCQSSHHAADSLQSNGDSSNKNDSSVDLKNVRLKKFAVAGHWMDSMADWLWRDRQLQLDNT